MGIITTHLLCGMERMEEKSENSQICPELGTEMGCGQDTVPNSEQQMKDELEISIQSGTPYLPGQVQSSVSPLLYSFRNDCFILQ